MFSNPYIRLLGKNGLEGKSGANQSVQISKTYTGQLEPGKNPAGIP